MHINGNAAARRFNAMKRERAQRPHEPQKATRGWSSFLSVADAFCSESPLGHTLSHGHGWFVVACTVLACGSLSLTHIGQGRGPSLHNHGSSLTNRPRPLICGERTSTDVASRATGGPTSPFGPIQRCVALGGPGGLASGLAGSRLRAGSSLLGVVRRLGRLLRAKLARLSWGELA